jgi:PPOX class probable F420-dependent enzyme
MRNTTLAAALSSFCALATAATAQTPPPTPPDRAAILKAARQVVEKARYCSFVTVGQDGALQARIVDVFPPDEAMVVWIGTNPVTRKVAEVKKDPRATLLCFDPAGPAYVTLVGRAEVVTDPAEKAKRWKEDWQAFYKDKNRGEDYVLIRVRPSRLEIVSYPDSLLNDPATWRPISVEFN